MGGGGPMLMLTVVSPLDTWGIRAKSPPARSTSTSLGRTVLLMTQPPWHRSRTALLAVARESRAGPRAHAAAATGDTAPSPPGCNARAQHQGCQPSGGGYVARGVV